ncbi:MAG: hypothetical protein AAF288_02705 [Planctomycetota bacterium]
MKRFVWLGVAAVCLVGDGVVCAQGFGDNGGFELLQSPQTQPADDQQAQDTAPVTQPVDEESGTRQGEPLASQPDVYRYSVLTEFSPHAFLPIRTAWQRQLAEYEQLSDTAIDRAVNQATGGPDPALRLIPELAEVARQAELRLEREKLFLTLTALDQLPAMKVLERDGLPYATIRELGWERQQAIMAQDPVEQVFWSDFSYLSSTGFAIAVSDGPRPSRAQNVERWLQSDPLKRSQRSFGYRDVRTVEEVDQDLRELAADHQVDPGMLTAAAKRLGRQQYVDMIETLQFMGGFAWSRGERDLARIIQIERELQADSYLDKAKAQSQALQD